MTIYHLDYVDAEHVRLDPDPADALMEALARMWEADPHQFSTRPCPTCSGITAVVGRPFGCIAKRARA